MSIPINTGFECNSNSPIDSRLIKTKAEMLSTSDDSMPDVYMCLNSEDNSIYIYNKDNAVDPETGKFQKVNVGGGGAKKYTTNNPFDTTFDPATGTSHRRTPESGPLPSEIKALGLKPGDYITFPCSSNDKFEWCSYEYTTDLGISDQPYYLVPRVAYTGLVMEDYTMTYFEECTNHIYLSPDALDDDCRNNSATIDEYKYMMKGIKGYLLMGSKKILVEEVTKEEGYATEEDLIADNTPLNSRKEGCRPWTVEYI